MHIPVYALWLIKEIFVAGFSLAAAAFKPDPGYRPVILRYPLRVTSAWEIFWFTSSITATPGTLSLGLREPPREGWPRIVIVQAVQGADPAAVMADLADMESRLAPRVVGIDHGVPGQGDTTELDPAFYEYPLETVGRQLRAPDMSGLEDTTVTEEAADKIYPRVLKKEKEK
ncbi:monovalent cation/H+ antiporter subunit E [Corynebacterium endometrii]|uniref:Putative monovalent cation/H+ antiporter subunit E n=1 Tax=Corynebacterium endometrii TaxID=2488819 RepID=A0A4P7QIS4_9CORY|nr:monovalent cation/H+ antiporter subunit E [Corynebacterium endometrii]QCB28727.1 putative monovalent cation/H+ antiporter subunit E [Corynebacterium endometrii]